MAINLSKYKLTPEQINRKINLPEYRLPSTIEEEQKIQEQGKAAEEFLAKPWYKQLKDIYLPGSEKTIEKFGAKPRKIITEAIAEVNFKTPAKFITSAIEVPKTFMTGKATQKEYKLPLLTPFKSYISEAEERAGKIIEGEKPLYTSLTPFVSVPLAGLETLGILKGLFGDAVITGGKTILGRKIIPGERTQGLIERNVRNLWNKFRNIRTSKEFDNVIEIVANPYDKKSAIEAVQKAGRPGGYETTGIFGRKIKYQPTKYQTEMAETIAPFYDKNLIKFNKNLNEGIEESAKSVEKFLNENKVNYNPEDLINRIESIEPPSLITPENTAAINRAKNITKDIIVSNEPTNFSLWKTRQKLDDAFELAKRGIIDPDRISAINLYIRELRQTINSYIAEITPAGKIGFSDKMRIMTNMYNARDEIATKIGLKIMKKAAYQNLPVLQKLIRNPFVKRGLVGGLIEMGLIGGGILIGKSLAGKR